MRVVHQRFVELQERPTGAARRNLDRQRVLLVAREEEEVVPGLLEDVRLAARPLEDGLRALQRRGQIIAGAGAQRLPGLRARRARQRGAAAARRDAREDLR